MVRCGNELLFPVRQIVPSLRHPDGQGELSMTEQLSLITTGAVFAFLAAIVIGLL
jgi:hypothetical protein